MSLPTDGERWQLDQVAFDLCETFSERSHHIDAALEVDPAFGSGWSRSALTHDLVVESAGRSASRVGLGFRPVNGSGREIIGERHRYRVRRARRDAHGNLVILVSSESSLAVEEEPSLFPTASWVLGWVVGADGPVAEVFVAPILGVDSGRPGRLILGPALTLGSGSPLGGGFTPSDEDDLGFGDEDDGSAADDLGE
jgi:hypothetical protein